MIRIKSKLILQNICKLHDKIQFENLFFDYLSTGLKRIILGFAYDNLWFEKACFLNKIFIHKSFKVQVPMWYIKIVKLVITLMYDSDSFSANSEFISWLLHWKSTMYSGDVDFCKKCVTNKRFVHYIVLVSINYSSQWLNNNISNRPLCIKLKKSLCKYYIHIYVTVPISTCWIIIIQFKSNEIKFISSCIDRKQLANRNYFSKTFVILQKSGCQQVENN